MMNSKNKTQKATTMRKSLAKRSANGATVETFYKSADGNSGQLALYPKNTWNATGDDTTTDPVPAALGGNTDTATAMPAAGTSPTVSTGGCGCSSSHKPVVFIAGVVIGLVVAWMMTGGKSTTTT
jgi:hypothetical protein